MAAGGLLVNSKVTFQTDRGSTLHLQIIGGNAPIDARKGCFGFLGKPDPSKTSLALRIPYPPTSYSLSPNRFYGQLY